ncbi:MAG: hypothetical protein WB525_15370, partial [Pseudolabrys sp.]
MPNFLGHADNYIPANPAVTPTHIVHRPDMQNRYEPTMPPFGAPVSRSRIPEGFATRQLLRNERRTFLIIETVQNAYVVWIGAPIDTSCPRVHIRICIRASREVPG